MFIREIYFAEGRGERKESSARITPSLYSAAGEDGRVLIIDGMNHFFDELFFRGSSSREVVIINFPINL